MVDELMKTKNNISRSNKKKGMSIKEIAESMTPDRIEYRKKKIHVADLEPVRMGSAKKKTVSMVANEL